MSVEKLSDDSKVYREGCPFTQIKNEIIEHIKDNDAYRIYSYLAAKSRDWVVVKEWTAKVCGVGERKAKQVWAYLRRCGLIEYHITRDDKGIIVKHDLKVLNGSKFLPDEPFLCESKPTGAENAPLDDIHRCNYPPSGESTRVDFAPLLNKDLTKQDFALRKKEKSFCVSENQKRANERKHDWAVPKPVNEQPRQTTKFWEPGNPDYDRLHARS